jgi:translation initiation factor eIF-2B subunit alpha
MLGRGKVFYEKLVAARGKVAKVAAHFITDGSVSININNKKIIKKKTSNIPIDF